MENKVICSYCESTFTIDSRYSNTICEDCFWDTFLNRDLDFDWMQSAMADAEMGDL